MTVKTTTHLNFRGEARAALEFYHRTFGGDLVAVSYREAGAVDDPAEAEQIMWGQVQAPNGFHVMAYDVPGRLGWNPGEGAFFVSVRGSEAAELTELWGRLADGATVVQPLAPAGWSPLYGRLRDRFGVSWVLDLEVPYSG